MLLVSLDTSLFMKLNYSGYLKLKLVTGSIAKGNMLFRLSQVTFYS